MGAAAPVNDFAFLVAERFSQDRLCLFLPEQRLENRIFVRIHCAFHDHFAQPPGRADAHDIWKAALGVDRKHDAGFIGAHHFLHASRECDFEMIKTLLFAIANCAIGKERRVTFAARFDDCVLAGDIQESFLLSGETRLRQILSRGAAAHRHIDRAFFVTLGKFAIGLANLLLDLLGKFAFQKK